MKKNNDYFMMMEELASFGVKIAAALEKNLTGFDASQMKGALDELHGIEHEADNKKHDMMQKLAHEFITPIEREDIVALAAELDNITDCTEDVLRKMYMMNITSPRDDVNAHTAHIKLMTEKVVELMKEFHDFKKSTEIKSTVIEINGLESEGDKIYEDSVRKLFTEKRDGLEVYAWAEIYRRFEHAYDACEHAADVVESVIMKNS